MPAAPAGPVATVVRQLPCEQVDPVAHAWPHDPQLLASEVARTHVVPQVMYPLVVSHPHDEYLHTLPVPLHLLPQEPQLLGSKTEFGNV